jgi:hypothetical protein
MGMVTKNNITKRLSPYILVIIEVFMYRTCRPLYHYLEKERKKERKREREKERETAII